MEARQSLQQRNLPLLCLAAFLDVMVTGADDPEGLKIMADLAEGNVGDPRPICSIPVRLRGDEWHTWLPPAENPAFEKYREFQAQFLTGELREQKTYLDKLHETDGPDVFVASYNGAKYEDGSVRSYSVWTKDVPTWLPKTDEIAFYDPETDSKDMIPWEHVADCSELEMEPLDLYPPRWAVSGFPSADQLNRLRGMSAGEKNE